MALIVQKFGGSSVADPECIRRVAKRVAEGYDEGNDMVVVVSAMGDTTDHLIELAKELNERASAREMDMLLSTGEQQTISLLAMTLNAMGYKAVSYTGWQAGIVTEDVASKAKILSISPTRIEEKLKEKYIVIVAGFQGATEEGEITTLGRGGSDTTAVALASALNADYCEIFTDVDGVYTTDPRMVPEAHKIDRISFDEMLELATMGAGVLHPRCVEVGKEFGTKIHVRSSFNHNPGTIVEALDGKTVEQQMAVSGIAFDRNVAKISIFDVPDRPGSAARIFDVLSSEHINVDMIIQAGQRRNENKISFTISSDDLEKTKGLMEAMKWEFHAKDTEYIDNIAKVSIVGAGMITNPGVAARMFDILAENGINIQMIATSEIKVSCAIDEGDLEKAVKALHEGFGLSVKQD
ncbi:MAG: aspartate kinase [Bacillota bacterium]|jgi:aspartate kinase